MSSQETLVSKGLDNSVCHFQYGFDCKGNKINSKDFITKIRKHDKFSMNEDNISKTVLQIADYEEHFAPVLESCELSLANLKDNEIDKCEIIDPVDKTRKYKSNRVAFVGEDTIDDHVLKTFILTPYKLIPTLVETFLYLLNSVHILNNHRVIHCNVMDTSILCDYNGIPILGNFRLSLLVPENIKDVLNYKSFVEYNAKNENACLEFQIFSFLMSTPNIAWNGQITGDQIERVLTDFYSNTNKTKHISELVREGEAEYKKYFNQFVGKPLSALIKALMKYVSYWDSYSLSIIYLRMMQHINMEVFYDSCSPLKEFINMLRTYVISIPGKARLSSKQIYDKVEGSFSVEVNRFEYYEMRNIMETIIKDRERADKIANNFRKTKIYLLQNIQ